MRERLAVLCHRRYRTATPHPRCAWHVKWRSQRHASQANGAGLMTLASISPLLCCRADELHRDMSELPCLCCHVPRAGDIQFVQAHVPLAAAPMKSGSMPSSMNFDGGKCQHTASELICDVFKLRGMQHQRTTRGRATPTAATFEAMGAP